MSEHTPTTEQVRFAYIDRRDFDSQVGLGEWPGDEEAGREFDRWLRQVEAAAAADAVEGAIHMVDDSDSAERLAKLADQWREEYQ